MVDVKEKVLRRVYRSCGFPLRFLDFNPVTDFEVDRDDTKENALRMKALEWFLTIEEDIVSWLDAGSSAFLRGPIGTGKTSLACAVGRLVVGEWIARSGPQREEPLFVQGGVIERLARPGRDELLNEGRRLAMSTRFMMIDDVGKVLGDEVGMRFLDNLIRRRWSDKLSTIVTGNIREEDEKESFGAALSDLFSDYESIIIPGQSRRGIDEQ